MFDRFLFRGLFNSREQNSKFWPVLSEFLPNEIYIGLDETLEIDTTWISRESRKENLNLLLEVRELF